MKLKLLPYILIIMLLCCGCAADSAPSMYDNEVKSLDTESYFSIVLPADWEVYEDEWQSFGAVSADGSAAISVLAEFGGFTFYTADELAAKAMEKVSLADLKLQADSKTFSNKEYSAYYSFTDAEGKEGVLLNYVYNPYTSVAYYIFITCSAADFAYYENIFAEIIKSFSLMLNQYEYYQMIEDTEILPDEEAGETE